MNASQVNRYFNDLAIGVLRRKHPSVNHVTIDAYKKKWTFSNGQLDINHDFAEGFLRGFGPLVMKLKINLQHIEAKNHGKFGYLINAFCSETLLELSLTSTKQNFFDLMERPFKRVVDVSIYSNYVEYFHNLKLNELFPEMQHLYYIKYSGEWGKTFPIRHYSNLNELQISTHFIVDFPKIFQLNPHLRKVTCDGPESRDAMKIINDHIPELKFPASAISDKHIYSNRSTVS